MSPRWERIRVLSILKKKCASLYSRLTAHLIGLPGGQSLFSCVGTGAKWPGACPLPSPWLRFPVLVYAQNMYLATALQASSEILGQFCSTYFWHLYVHSVRPEPRERDLHSHVRQLLPRSLRLRTGRHRSLRSFKPGLHRQPPEEIRLRLWPTQHGTRRGTKRDLPSPYTRGLSNPPNRHRLEGQHRHNKTHELTSPTRLRDRKPHKTSSTSQTPRIRGHHNHLGTRTHRHPRQRRSRPRSAQPGGSRPTPTPPRLN